MSARWCCLGREEERSGAGCEEKKKWVFKNTRQTLIGWNSFRVTEKDAHEANRKTFLYRFPRCMYPGFPPQVDLRFGWKNDVTVGFTRDLFWGDDFGFLEQRFEKELWHDTQKRKNA